MTVPSPDSVDTRRNARILSGLT